MKLPTSMLAQMPNPSATCGPLILPGNLQPTSSSIAGLSLVTCCKNRVGNLVRALPSWLALPEVTEVVIVDWSSDTPVADSLAAAGLTDPRIRVARVEGEPRWILTYAFNLGFRLARGQRVLKADADILIEPGFFGANPLAPGQFIAGNWRKAEVGQEFVNGFFYIHLEDLAAVNGFNEYITTYGWDDDDLYDRLTTAGMVRIDVTPGTVRHLDHDDTARIGPSDAALTAWDDLNALTLFKIRTNRLVATMMPNWDRNRIMMPYDTTDDHARPTLQRRGQTIHRVPDHLRRVAERLAAYELLSWRTGLRAFDLPEAALDLLLACRRLDDIRALHVELMLGEAGLVAVTAPRHLVVELDEAALAAWEAALAPVWPVIVQAATAGRVPVLRAPSRQNPLPQASQRSRPRGCNFTLDLADAARLPFVPSYHPIGMVRDVTAGEVAADPLTPVLRIHVVAPAAATQPQPSLAPDSSGSQSRSGLAAPVVSCPKARLFIDAQHGLGNRLRAIGSAAAVAEATGRQLVVVWEPDHHCEARLTDLFAFEGPVIGNSFLADAQRAGATVLNYMEIEAGAVKGAPLVLTDGQDAYLRSAYVINHPASTWDSENVLLHRLRPAPQVEALLEGQPERIDIGLHVRMEGSPGTDLNSYDRSENWTPEGHAAIHHWRTQSHYARFMARLDALLAKSPAAQVWLAADLPQTYRAFAETYGPRIAMLERPLYDRSTTQLRYALADVLMLARARHLLGSNWSSFSELALRLSTSIRRHERSGVDF